MDDKPLTFLVFTPPHRVGLYVLGADAGGGVNALLVSLDMGDPGNSPSVAFPRGYGPSGHPEARRRRLGPSLSQPGGERPPSLLVAQEILGRPSREAIGLQVLLMYGRWRLGPSPARSQGQMGPPGLMGAWDTVGRPFEDLARGKKKVNTTIKW